MEAKKAPRAKHVAPQPKPIVTLFGIEYDAKGLCVLGVQASIGMFALSFFSIAAGLLCT